MPTATTRVGVVAPSSPVGQVELARGVARLRSAGLDVRIHPQCANVDYIFAGTDEARAAALADFAFDPSIDVVWCAGGGDGATRLLPILEEITAQRGKPTCKLLVGYSDITVLHEFVRSRWNWSSLHFPMPSASDFPKIDERHFQAAVSFAKRQRPSPDPWSGTPLKFLDIPLTRSIQGPLVGGNLSLWAALSNTPHESPRTPGRIIFLEDVSEAPYRIDRMSIHLEQVGCFDGAAAIVLGDFTHCRDDVSKVLASEGSDERVPIRPGVTLEQVIPQTYGRISRRLNIPVAYGLPAGHGPNFAPVPLGAQYELTPSGELRLLQWDWLTNAL